MTETIESYLDALKKELYGADPALIQDALYDAEEYLRSEFGALRSSRPEKSPQEALSEVIAKYGTASEIAQEYRSAEARLSPGTSTVRPTHGRGLLARLFGVLADPAAYAALFFMFFSLFTGIFYFTWAAIGLSLSLGLLVLVIGLPLFALFLASVRGVSFLEGRFVEAMLGVRMPRRPAMSRSEDGWIERIKRLFAERQTWTSMVYMFLMLPLGIVYFTLFTTLLSLALAFIVSPITRFEFHLPLLTINGTHYLFGAWAVPLLCLLGFLLIPMILHLSKAVGRVHGNLAKHMLVQV